MAGYQYKTIKLLSTFSEKDFSDFEKFIRSPFFNERTSLIKVYVFLRNHICSKCHDEINIKSIHNNVFPENPYDELKTRKRLSSLNKLIERYFSLINQQFYYSPEKVYFLKEVNKRGLDDLFISGLNEFRKGMTEGNFSDIAFQFDYLKLLYEEYRMFKSINDTKAATKTFSEIEKNSEQIGVFLYLLNSSVTLIRKFREIKYTNDNKPINEYIQQKKEIILNNKHLQVFADFCIILNEDKAENIYELSSFILKNHSRIFYGITDLIFNLLLEYAVFKYNAGNEIDRRSYNKLIESMDKTGFIERCKLIPPMSFIAITILYSSTEENDYADRFVRKYISHLNETLRNNVFYSSKALLSFSEKEYDKAVIHLTKVETGDFNLHIFAKTLLIQTYYELGLLLEVNKASDTLKRYIYRKTEIPEITKEASLSFLHYIQKLITLKKNMFTKSENLRKKIETERMLIRKLWLTEKALEIEEEKRKLVKSINTYGSELEK